MFCGANPRWTSQLCYPLSSIMTVSSKYSPLLFVCSLLFTPGCAFLFDWVDTASSAPLVPHFTECISREMATFSCWWSTGSFQNISSPEDLKVFYERKSPGKTDRNECPQYNYLNQECFFDANHTTAWDTYCLELHVHNVTYANEDDCFTLPYIVIPDPPVALNWTLLNLSPSGLSYDVLVSWKPPPSADVKSGWMRVEYELQYRELNSTKWKNLEIQYDPQQTIYGLHVGREYEVHIRSKMKAFVKFGEFSKSIFIQIEGSGDDGTSFPVMLALIFGISGIFIIIMFIVVSQHQRLIMILLPPVPAPKIKGIDSELLKKGKLEELNLILSGGGMGGLSAHAPDFYQDEPWVEFIEVDIDGADSSEKEDNQGSDTQRLLALSQQVGNHMHIGSSNATCFPDDDSGRASCYDLDHPDQDPLIPMATLLPGQPEDREASADRDQTTAPQTWVNTDFYAQVSNVMPSGGVVLSPGQQLRAQENQEDAKKGSKKETCDDNAKDIHFQLLVVDPENTEIKQNSTPSTSPVSNEGYQTVPLQTVDPNPIEEQQSPYILTPDSPQSPPFTPVADYTVVQEVDSQHSLLLNPPPQQQAPPPSCQSQHPLKSLPAMPVDYITPDLFGHLSQ
ncbi:growth hormone receptor a [Periophthalmus magnuspinnatus]|uniref:growth hormone receptor a n=1 Tax=Periophthalmus magnuspinnatus TaxID=409849 RepID=UPI00145A6FFB|nr:growth hormone receptor a [Periophthalmus magnuspinnatus]